jgi:hypothetical protein
MSDAFAEADNEGHDYGHGRVREVPHGRHLAIKPTTAILGTVCYVDTTSR